MKEVRIAYLSGDLNWNADEMLPTKILQKYYKVIIDNENPDYVFCSVWNHDYLKQNYKDAIRIMWCTESYIPDFNAIDYGVGFHNIEMGDRYIHIPLKGLVGQYNKVDALQQNQRNISNNRENFCAFVYSNPAVRAPIREQLLNRLNEYKLVMSGGKYKNNVGGPVKDKIEFMKTFKFSVACENALLPGYTTEKIIDAFVAGCIPIYWGNEEIENIFNPKAFINVHNFKSIDEVIAKVVQIDNDDKAYDEMINCNIFNEGVIEKEDGGFEGFLLNIFEQDKSKAYRRNLTGFEDFLEDNFRKYEQDMILINKMKSLYSKLPRFIRRIIKGI